MSTSSLVSSTDRTLLEERVRFLTGIEGPVKFVDFGPIWLAQPGADFPPQVRVVEFERADLTGSTAGKGREVGDIKAQASRKPQSRTGRAQHLVPLDPPGSLSTESGYVADLVRPGLGWYSCLTLFGDSGGFYLNAGAFRATKEAFAVDFMQGRDEKLAQHLAGKVVWDLIVAQLAGFHLLESAYMRLVALIGQSMDHPSLFELYAEAEALDSAEVSEKYVKSAIAALAPHLTPPESVHLKDIMMPSMVQSGGKDRMVWVLSRVFNRRDLPPLLLKEVVARPLFLRELQARVRWVYRDNEGERGIQSPPSAIPRSLT